MMMLYTVTACVCVFAAGAAGSDEERAKGEQKMGANRESNSELALKVSESKGRENLTHIVAFIMTHTPTVRTVYTECKADNAIVCFPSVNTSFLLSGSELTVKFQI
jgi:hypothetical protein